MLTTNTEYSQKTQNTNRTPTEYSQKTNRISTENPWTSHIKPKEYSQKTNIIFTDDIQNDQKEDLAEYSQKHAQNIYRKQTKY